MAKINKKLLRVLDEIQKAEEKIAQWQRHVEELNILKKQLENDEIVKSIRSVKLESRELLGVLSDIQDGVIVLPTDNDMPESVSDKMPEKEEPKRTDISKEDTAASARDSDESIPKKEMVENESKN